MKRITLRRHQLSANRYQRRNGVCRRCGYESKIALCAKCKNAIRDTKADRTTQPWWTDRVKSAGTAAFLERLEAR